MTSLLFCRSLMFAFLLVSSLAFASPRIIIENVTLIDAAHPVRENMTVVLRGDVIESIEESRSQIIDIKMEDKVIDATGKFLIPGLWDAHVHLTFIPELDYKTAYALFLKNGITSIRDTGGVFTKLQPAIDYANENPEKTPRLFYSGPLIDGNLRVYKGQEPGFPELSIGVNEATDLEAVVNGLVEQGVTFLKTYEMLSAKTFLNLLEIAEQKNLRVTSHIPLSISLVEAIDGGLDGMQHIRNLDLACAKNAEEILAYRKILLKNLDSLPGSALRTRIHQSQRYTAIDQVDEARCTRIIKYLAINNVFQTPTLTINTVGSKRFFASSKWRETYQFLPTKVQESWQADSINLAKQPVLENNKIFEEWSMKIVGLFNEHGVKIMAGTDTPIGFLTPGYSLHKELELLVEAGLTPLQALKSATITPAEFFNLENKMGTIDPGKYADLVILNSNPLKKIKNTQDIHTVISKGKIQNLKK